VSTSSNSSLSPRFNIPPPNVFLKCLVSRGGENTPFCEWNSSIFLAVQPDSGEEWPEGVQMWSGRLMSEGHIKVPETLVSKVIESQNRSRGHFGWRQLLRELRRRYFFVLKVFVNRSFFFSHVHGQCGHEKRQQRRPKVREGAAPPQGLARPSKGSRRIDGRRQHKGAGGQVGGTPRNPGGGGRRGLQTSWAKGAAVRGLFDQFTPPHPGECWNG